MMQEIENRFSLLGGIVPIGKAFAPVDETELTLIETAIGVTLPDDYRKFVKKYGMSSFGELVRFQPIEGEKGPLSHFYGAKTCNQSLTKCIERYRGRMPDNIIPIADDGGGNQICIGIYGMERGKLYYWDHCNEWDADDYMEAHDEPMPAEIKFQNINLIAESFEDFILRLETTANEKKLKS